MNNQGNKNHYVNASDFSPTGNFPEQGQSGSRQNEKKPVMIILVAVFAFLLCAIGVVAGVLLFTSQDHSEEITDLLKKGECDEAYDLYIDKYGKGKSNEKLEDALLARLLDIEDEYRDKDITQKRALEEVDTIKKMDIDAIEDDVKTTRDYIEKLYASSNNNSSSSNSGNSNSNSGSNNNNSSSNSQQNSGGYINQNDTIPPEELPAEFISDTPYISNASTLVGSVLPASNEDSRRSFGADKAIDGAYDSCWCVNTSSSGGAGAKIKFTLTNKSYVHGIKIINGNNFHPYENIYSSNGQVKSFTLTFSDGSSKTFTASYNYANNAFETFPFNTPVATDYIILTVNSGFTGSKYTQNVCLGEFAVY